MDQAPKGPLKKQNSLMPVAPSACALALSLTLGPMGLTPYFPARCQFCPRTAHTLNIKMTGCKLYSWRMRGFFSAGHRMLWWPFTLPSALLSPKFVCQCHFLCMKLAILPTWRPRSSRGTRILSVKNVFTHDQLELAENLEP